MEGEIVPLLQRRFLKDYFMVIEDQVEIEQIEKEIDLYFPPTTCEEETFVQIICDGPDQRTDHMRSPYIKLIATPQSIWIQSPYVIADMEFLHVLKIASQSGIDVKFMILGIPDNYFVHRTTTAYIKELLEAGIEVYFYEIFLYSKIIVIDRVISTVGSVNMEVRRFSINFESTAFIYDKKLLRLVHNSLKLIS